LNLARRMHLGGIDQLWVADITYIRLRTSGAAAACCRSPRFP
jgi:hypothetical protein